ncbi:MAG: 50S ribosomal protein L15 [candidate division WS2 bacterium ADurb.Bin280]|uniref:Large ribosomal subunit protein uL15 n=1 Tax=candidate division WS2 bacterium ADurb.Bin280 TaxID=1852829 RepID=A0A1V5SBZ7_9BACT|nr:MAG: 50S ribosomal protein L15 [candidate division WS2 bacterium ADurb.Bin280]
MNNLKLLKSVKKTKRVGRGISSGKGKTSGRGMNGQRSRTGAATSRIEGGQTKLIMRLPKVGGFKSTKRKNPFVITTTQLGEKFKSDEKVTFAEIVKRFTIKNPDTISFVKLIKGKEEVEIPQLADEIVCSKSIIEKNPVKKTENSSK